jgi:hypothetical protein
MDLERALRGGVWLWHWSRSKVASSAVGFLPHRCKAIQSVVMLPHGGFPIADCLARGVWQSMERTRWSIWWSGWGCHHTQHRPWSPCWRRWWGCLSLHWFWGKLQIRGMLPLTAMPVGDVVLVGGVERASRIKWWWRIRRHPRGGIIFGDIHQLEGCVDGFGGWVAVSTCNGLQKKVEWLHMSSILRRSLFSTKPLNLGYSTLWHWLPVGFSYSSNCPKQWRHREKTYIK